MPIHQLLAIVIRINSFLRVNILGKKGKNRIN